MPATAPLHGRLPPLTIQPLLDKLVRLATESVERIQRKSLRAIVRVRKPRAHAIPAISEEEQQHGYPPGLITPELRLELVRLAITELPQPARHQAIPARKRQCHVTHVTARAHGYRPVLAMPVWLQEHVPLVT
jgi:hypothetical protein